MRKNLRVLALCLFGGVLASVGFLGTGAIADSFTDVPPGNFFHDDIDWLTDYDIANGFPNGTFEPEANIKRQQAALWFHNYNDELERVDNPTDPAAGATFEAFVNCPGDKRVVAGGGVQDLTGVMMTASYPVDENSWVVRWESVDGNPVDSASATAYALCLPLPNSGNG